MATNSAVYNGINGVAKFDVGGSATTLASITAFSLSQTGDTIETTAMTESARTYLPGLTTATGTMDLFFRDDDSAQQALFTGPGSAAATVELYPSGTTTGIKLNADWNIIDNLILNSSFAMRLNNTKTSEYDEDGNLDKIIEDWRTSSSGFNLSLGYRF